MLEFKDTFNTQKCYTRLIDEYNTHKNLIIAFDFDNTVFDYHNKGYVFESVISLLKECSDLGLTMVLFTCNDNEKTLSLHREFLITKGIRVDYINESPIMQTKKPYYNILLDDRAGLSESFRILTNVIDFIKYKKSCE